MEPVIVRRKAISEINVVPYIDVMLVLLVVFMVTAPLLTHGIKIQLPEEDAGTLSADQDPIIVSIKADGSFYLNIAKEPDKPMSLDDIQLRIDTMLARKPNQMVLIEGDAQVSYGKVVALMSALQSAGSANVGLITEPPTGPSSG